VARLCCAVRTLRPASREQHTGVLPRGVVQGLRVGAPGPPIASSAADVARDHGGVSTRTLLILAAITGVAILAAGAIQILLAR
jgi:hypothetical protein